MGILNKLGGRHRLLAGSFLRNLARIAVRMRIGRLNDVSESFRGVFRIRASGVSGYYQLGPRDNVGEVLYWYGLNRFEPDTIPLFIEFARSARGTLDIGSNTGLYSILACAANPAGKVIAWEPVPYLADKLRANIALNGFLDRCDVREAAADGIDGHADFYISDDTTMSSLSGGNATSNMHSATTTSVRVERVDTALAADWPVDLIKVDVEGNEFKTLSGAVATLERWHPKVIFECLPTTDSLPLESLLRGIGYSIYSLSSSGPAVVKSIPSMPRSRDHNFLASFSNIECSKISPPQRLSGLI